MLSLWRQDHQVCETFWQSCQAEHKKKTISGILHEANDWKIDSDLPEFQRETNEFVFPFWICSTDLKPDCVIFSMHRKICSILEMTVPMDVNMEKWHSVKLEKYQVGIQ